MLKGCLVQQLTLEMTEVEARVGCGKTDRKTFQERVEAQDWVVGFCG